MTAAVVTLAIALAGAVAAVWYFARRALNKGDEVNVLYKAATDATAARDAARAAETRAATAADDLRLALAAQTDRANRAEEALRAHLRSALAGSDADVDRAVRQLLATDLRAEAAARAADHRGAAAATAVRPAGVAGAGGDRGG